MEIYNFDSCPYSDRNGGYGGAAGDKDGILFRGERWMVKYPKELFGMRKSDKLEKNSLTPLSEFLGSHIYAILGYPVHETLLGYRKGKIVVACKDFCLDGERLFEIRTIKNVHLNEVAEKAGVSSLATGEDRMINLRTLFVHMDLNPELCEIDGLKERFWDQVVVDGLIANGDRNNGNWGLLVGERKTLAPIFDNGAAFYPKKSEASILKALGLPKEEADRNYLNVVFPYTLNQKDHLNWKGMLSLGEGEIPKDHLFLLHSSIRRNANFLKARKAEIEGLFQSVPETYEGLPVLSVARRQYYLSSFKARAEYLVDLANSLSQ
jgi:hypothetical protein